VVIGRITEGGRGRGAVSRWWNTLRYSTLRSLAPAAAQNPNALNILGTVSQFSAASITIKTEGDATVTGTAIANGSNALRATFPGGESELIVDPGVPVTRMDRVGPEALTVGARVRVRGTRGADGALVNRVTLQ